MKKIFIASVIVTLLTGMTVCADNEINAVADSDTHEICVSGDMGTVNAKKRVVITVLPKGGTADDMKSITADNIKQSVEALYMTYTDDDGKYQVNFCPNLEVGEYTAVVSGPAKGESYSTVFFNPDDVTNILTKLESARKAKDANEIKSILAVEENLRSLGIGKLDDEVYGIKFDDLGISSFELLAKYEEPYDLASTVLAAYREACAIKAFNSIEDESDVLALLEQCDETLGILDTKAYAIYDGLKNKLSIDSAMKDGGFTSKDGIRERFCDKVYLCAIDDMENWSEFGGFVKANNDYLDLDMTGYKKLKSPSDVDKAIAGRSFGSMQDLRKAFDKAVKEQSDKEAENKKAGGTGGGGTGGSKTSTYTAPVVVPQAPAAFRDIDSVEWAKEAIVSLAAQKIVNGKAEGLFYPNDSVTREEAAKILVEAFGVGKDGASCSFADLEPNHWSYGYVAAAKRAGIINGYDDGSFGVGKGVTRQELAVMIYRNAKANGISFADGKKTEFDDEAQIAPYAKDAVEALGSAGIINGKGNGAFAPNDLCTRAEAAKIIYAVLNIR